MPFAAVTIPTVPRATDARLYYAHIYDFGRAKFDFLHLVRSNSLSQLDDPRRCEELYWRDLDANRNEFAEGLQEPFDLVVDPPSKSGYHRPFVSAFLTRLPQVRCVRFLKSESVQSEPVNVARLRQVVSAAPGNGGHLSEFRNVLIVDDVFATATTAAVTLEKLRAGGLSPDAAITVACPLWLQTDVARQARDYVR